jgi:hypothetical protein
MRIPLSIKNLLIIEAVELNIFVMLLSYQYSVVMDGHHLVPRLRVSGAVPPLPYITSRHVQGQFYLLHSSMVMDSRLSSTQKPGTSHQILCSERGFCFSLLSHK